MRFHVSFKNRQLSKKSFTIGIIFTVCFPTRHKICLACQGNNTPVRAEKLMFIIYYRLSSHCFVDSVAVRLSYDVSAGVYTADEKTQTEGDETDQFLAGKFGHWWTAGVCHEHAMSHCEPVHLQSCCVSFRWG